MADGDLKGDLINDAYSKMRISGLTVNPTSEDNVLALRRLENMMSEFFERNICVDYAFEDEPDFNTLSNVPRKFHDSISSVLASRLLPDFGKDMNASPMLLTQSRIGYSFLSARTAPMRETQYPNRMPRGNVSALRYTQGWNRFYRPQPEVPLNCASNTMFIGDIEDFVEHFDAYLLDAETIDSYVLTADTGLTIESESLSSPDISYRVNATGTTDTTSDSLLQVKIVATTSSGRVTTRIINFELEDPDNA